MTGGFAAFFKIDQSIQPRITLIYNADIISSFNGIKTKNVLHQYHDYLSDFKNWNQKPYAKKWLLYPENLVEHLYSDETSLSHEKLYTFLTNKAAKRKKK